MRENFFYFAMMYLNDWYSSDKPFMEGLSSRSRPDQLLWFNKAAKYYKVTRNFVKLDNEERLEGALAILNKVSGPITDENVVTSVNTLANSFQKKYGKYVVSAASKFLWLRFRSPVIIFDNRVLRWLKTNGYSVHQGSGYGEYRKKWIAAFQAHEKLIQSACNDLPAVRKYTYAHAESEKDVSNLCSTRWFRERVFDKYLWFNASG